MTIKRSQNIIVDKSFDFSLKVLAFCDGLESNKKYVLSRQLLKSGTSIGANVREAQNAESLADFIHKMKIALKESEETDYWLSLCDKSELYPNCQELLDLNAELWRILTSIISKSKQKTKIG
ncbi:MAG: four helix bundle protein [Bacteroidetes bacterium]|nr:four helix bundle protein [Bacteroidota bacterium]